MDPAERRQEIVTVASRVRQGRGLSASLLGRSRSSGWCLGLINHYFGSVDDWMRRAFGHAAEAERAVVFGRDATQVPDRSIFNRLLARIPAARSGDLPVSLLWSGRVAGFTPAPSAAGRGGAAG
jgi:DNA-binding transcriptional regulator YbjK